MVPGEPLTVPAPASAAAVVCELSAPDPEDPLGAAGWATTAPDAGGDEVAPPDPPAGGWSDFLVAPGRPTGTLS